MLASSEPGPRVFRRQLSGAAVLRISLDSIIAISALLTIAAIYHERFQGPYIILALIVFSLTFPGTMLAPGSLFGLAREILINWVVVLGILFFFGYASGYLNLFPTKMIMVWAATVPSLLWVAQIAIPVLMPRLLAMEGVTRKAVVAGSSDLGARLVDGISRATLLGIDVVGVFDDRRSERRVNIESAPYLGTLTDLAQYIKENSIDLIYITLPMASQPRILKLLNELRDTTASIYFTPDIFVFDLIQARMDSINGLPVVAVCETPFYGVNGLIKRLSDYVLSLIILVLISPLLVSIAIAIKINSPGPILFKQRRYGLDGKEITVYKFRTMKVLEDGAQVRQASRDDDRIYPLGRILRKTSLDELPQFVNVLQGRMSIVGPRPHAVAHNEQYRKLINGYMVRHKVKPGITGWAQVSGFRGETETVEKMRQRIEYDLAYLRNWSLRLDLVIILRTVLLIFGDKGAY